MALELEEWMGAIKGAAFQVRWALDFAVVGSYLRAASVDHGLLLNFSKSKLEFKRVIAHANSA